MEWNRRAGHLFLAVTVLWLAAFSAGCTTDVAAPAPLPERNFRMGFSGIPPRADLSQAIAAINMWSLRADAAIMSYEIPWGVLLDGVSPDTEVTTLQLPLASYYRSKGHALWVYLDPANGLNRSGESDSLIARGRSITEPEIQRIFRRYAVAVDSIIHPDHLGLALETNLIRSSAPAALYQAIRQAATDAAADVRARDPLVKLSVSVQVDYAWGHFDGGGYRGVSQDLADFPFIQELGLSSYPYLAGYSDPDSIPIDYYSRLAAGSRLRVMVTEGGWTSASLDSIITSSQEKQRRYILRQVHLLDSARAIAVFQLTFTDLDLSTVHLPPGSILPLFARLGLVDVNLNPKLSLGAWDGTFARPRR